MVRRRVAGGGRPLGAATFTVITCSTRALRRFVSISSSSCASDGPEMARLRKGTLDRPFIAARTVAMRVFKKTF